jgi:flagellar FliL protein
MAKEKAAAKNGEEAAGAAPAKKGLSLGLVIGLLVTTLALGAGGAWYFASSAAAAKAAQADEDEDSGESESKPSKKKDKKKAKSPEGPKAPANYLALDPAFVVNLADADATRYLQTSVEVMARDPESIEAAKANMPAIRNSLLMLFSQKTAVELNDRDGREKLRELALAEVQKVLEAETGNPGVEAVFFTSFVTQ